MRPFPISSWAQSHGQGQGSPVSHEFDYAALWCKWKVHARLEGWIKTDSCPWSGAKESLQHALTQCWFMPLVPDVLDTYYGHVQIEI